MVWNQISQTPSSVVNKASSLLFQWQRARVNLPGHQPINDREGALVWRRPEPGWVLCNVDAAVFDRRGKSSFGCLLRDDKGCFIAGYVGSFAGVLDPTTAEAIAFREALSWLKNRRVHQVYIELDSLTVV